MSEYEQVNILLVDDQPDKLLTYEAILHELEQANAFVVAVDPARSWFRYHSLFADLLRLELRRSESHVVRQLHQSAQEIASAGRETVLLDVPTTPLPPKLREAFVPGRQRYRPRQRTFCRTAVARCLYYPPA